ncbi:hypothetical protein RRG08_057229 [Elysia crispata]|uniref:Amino acid transporter transmembrane domain-containing protein n=1 Tax=Elysia crispata TaxID=231223 RepID=A0AAE0YKP2_9GAST|nr:hypothetical protein RRG08_057229 [Elysia crispata]
MTQKGTFACQIGNASVLAAPAFGTGWISSAFLVVNATIGAGLLYFPLAYHLSGGIFIAVMMQSIILVFVMIAHLILGYCADIKGSNNYQDVIHSLCGARAQLACAVCITLYCFGTCTTFLIVIGDQWEMFFLTVARDLYCNARPFYMGRGFVIFITSCIFIMPMCFPKRIDFLKYVSIVGVLGTLYVVGLVITKYFDRHTNAGPIATHPNSWMNVFLVVPDICFSYQSHYSVISIYSCMEKRNLREFAKAVGLAMIVCKIIYTVTAILGYLQFGANVTSDVLVSFRPETAVTIAVIIMAVKASTTYPILLFCGRTGFECVWASFWRMGEDDMIHHEKIRRVITTVVWFGLTLFLGISISSIGDIIQVLGAFAAIFIFVFPGMCLLKAMQNQLESGISQPQKVYWLRGLAVFFIVVGTFIFGLTLSQAIIRDLKGATHDSLHYTC